MNAQTTFIFDDISGSVQVAEEQIKKRELILKKTLLERVNQKGTKVILSYLQKNSGNLANSKVFVFEPIQSSTVSTGGSNEAREKANLMRSKFLFITKVLNALKADVPRSNATYILESLPKIYEQLKLDSDLQVISFSDMLEYSPRRKLYLLSKSDAEKKGIADAKGLIKDFGLSKTTYPNLQIDCYLPVSMTNETTTFSYISYYWETVFKTLFGTDNIKFHTL